METPSHGGGLSTEAVERMEYRKRREKERGTALLWSGMLGKIAKRSFVLAYERSEKRRSEWDDETDSRDNRRERVSSVTPSSGTETPRRGGLFKRSQWSSMTPSRQSEPPTPGRPLSRLSTPRLDSGYGRSTGTRLEWSRSTPAVRSSALDEAALEYPEEYTGDEEDRRRWEEEQAQLDRDWYSMEETGVRYEEAYSMFSISI